MCALFGVCVIVEFCLFVRRVVVCVVLFCVLFYISYVSFISGMRQYQTACTDREFFLYL